ncbi:hypothetical protein BH23BAC3_BH23BAC3_30050 [soil metagenome]
MSYELFFIIGDEMTTAIGLESPDLNFEQIDGSKKSLSEFDGQVVVINLMRTICTGCSKQFPALSRLQDQYKNDNLVVLYLSPEPHKVIRKYADDHELRGEFGHIADRQSLEFPYQLLTTPSTIVIGADGIIKDLWISAKSYNEIENRIEKFLSPNR